MVLAASLYFVNGEETQTMTLTPSVFGSLHPDEVGGGAIYFISGFKSVLFYTFDATGRLGNAKVESAVLRVKTDIVMDPTRISAYRWMGSWKDYTWDNFTLDRDTVGEKNCIGSKQVSSMDTWFTYSLSPPDTILYSLNDLPITFHLESSYLGSNLPETYVSFKDVQLVLTYTTSTPAPTNNPTPTAPELTPIALVIALVTVSSVFLIAKKKSVIGRYHDTS